MSELSGTNKGAIYCQETDVVDFCGLGRRCFLGSNGETGEEHANCRKNFCIFVFFLSCSDERFFWPVNLCSLGLKPLL